MPSFKSVQTFVNGSPIEDKEEVDPNSSPEISVPNFASLLKDSPSGSRETAGMQHAPLDQQLAQQQQAANEEYSPLEKLMSAFSDPVEHDFMDSHLLDDSKDPNTKP